MADLNAPMPPDGSDRRAFLRTAGLGAAAAAAWSAPQIITVPSAAAATVGPPPVAVGFESESTGGVAFCGADSVTVDVPAGTMDGDLLVAVAAYNTLSTVTQASFTSEATADEDSGASVDTVRSTVFTRVASSEPASYTFNRAYSGPGFCATSRRLRVVLVAYRGARNIDAIASNVLPAAETTPQTFPTTTTNGPDRTVLRVGAATFRSLGDPAWGPVLDGVTPLNEITDTGGGRAIVWADETQAVAGPTGTRDATLTPPVSGWYGVKWTIALRPFFG